MMSYIFGTSYELPIYHDDGISISDDLHVGHIYYRYAYVDWRLRCGHYYFTEAVQCVHHQTGTRSHPSYGLFISRMLLMMPSEWPCCPHWQMPLFSRRLILIMHCKFHAALYWHQSCLFLAYNVLFHWLLICPLMSAGLVHPV